MEFVSFRGLSGGVLLSSESASSSSSESLLQLQIIAPGEGLGCSGCSVLT